MTIRIETERLLLRPMLGEDAEAYIAMMADADVAKFLTPDHRPRPRADEWRAFATMVGHWAIRGYGMFSVIEKETGDWVGRVGPWMPEGWPSLECGWGIARSHWGKGYAPEAAIASVRWMFNEFPDLPRVISLIDADNANSQAVARKTGEHDTGETFELWGITLNIWAADRAAWLEEFGDTP
ncbi:MAG: GNAT family N-acetyltransferase [Pseudomonadota bacterium]